MNPLIEEARGVVGSFDERELIPSISGEPGPNAYRLRLIRRLAAALEAAEKRAEEAERGNEILMNFITGKVHGKDAIVPANYKNMRA